MVAPLVALCTDGTQVSIRPLADSDRDALGRLVDRLSDTSIYLRFFSANRESGRAYYTALPVGDERRLNVVAIAGEEIVGIAGYEVTKPGEAEFAVLVDDAWHGHGVGTLLVEHLLSQARRHGITTVVADVLERNSAMLDVLRDLGYQRQVTYSGSQERQAFELTPTEAALEAVEAREAVADVASLTPLLRPRAVAVVGASDRPKSVGSGLMQSMTAAGYAGPIYPVNARQSTVAGLKAYPSVRDIAAPVDLAVIAVPATQVVGVLHDCGAAGIGQVVLVTAGFRETGQADLEATVLATAREHGIRLIGPNCLGVINTDDDVRLSATFAPLGLSRGGFGLASQSGALGIAVLQAVNRRGLGISQFVSMGNKADVSGSDLLLWWERQQSTTVIGLYLESIKDPQHFARIARRVSRTRPILLLKSGRTDAGQRAGMSHTAAAATSDVLVDALCDQAGVVRVESVQELVDTAVLLGSQPLPRGPRVVVVGNSGGPEILATDAATAAGLTVAALSDGLARDVRALAPRAASVTNPVDLGGDADSTAVTAVVGRLAASDEVDAVLVVAAPTVALDIAELRAALGELDVNRTVVLTELAGDGDRTFCYPEQAATALARAWQYVQRRSEPSGSAPLLDIDETEADAVLGAAAAQGILDDDATAQVLRAYGLRLPRQALANDADSAVRAAESIGYPVVMKSTGMAHRTEHGGVHLGLGDAAAVRQAHAACAVLSPTVLIQETVPAGTEIIVGAVRDPSFGPLVGLGAGGIMADLIGHRAYRMAPLRSTDIAALVAGVPAALRDGFRGSPPIPEQALTQVIGAISALVNRYPEIAELDLNPVISTGSELIVVDAKLRLAPHAEVRDPLAPHLASTEQRR